VLPVSFVDARDLLLPTGLRAAPRIGEPLAVTTSVGAATGPLGRELVGEADAALYEAKHGGRDRCVIAGGEAS
jgi:GGDEF domain-containing protein